MSSLVEMKKCKVRLTRMRLQNIEKNDVPKSKNLDKIAAGGAYKRPKTISKAKKANVISKSGKLEPKTLPEKFVSLAEKEINTQTMTEVCAAPNTSAPSIADTDDEDHSNPEINDEFNEIKVEDEMEFIAEKEFCDGKDIPPPRKRIRRSETYKAIIAKENVERGAERKTKTKIIPAKVFAAQTTCKCVDDKKPKPSCSTKVSVERQKQIFEAYYQYMDWSQKTLFLRARIQRQPVKTKKSPFYSLVPLKSREFTHFYSFTDDQDNVQEVCRDFFVKCLQITSSRIFNALNTQQSNPGASENRGRAASANKTSDANKEAVRQFIDSIPKYEPCHQRSKAQRKFIYHTLNVVKLYQEYKSSRELKYEEFVSEYVFREIFNKEYNVSFKRRYTETCRICDEINADFNSELVGEQRKLQLRLNKLNHIKLVEKTHSEFVSVVKNAEECDGEVVVLTFSLQKTLETPSLASSVAIYKRQLWTYNLCVYDEVEKRAYMYVWSENVASRGGQEIGSCLLKHFHQHITPKTKELILYSDACGGQNRNIKLTLLLKKYLHDLAPDDALRTIKQKFFVPGHSYNSCDRAFGFIEKERKSASNIYTPTHWVRLIEKSKKAGPKFIVTAMQASDFASSAKLQAITVNSKENEEGKKIDWLQFQAMTYRKAEPFNFQICDSDGNMQTISIQKKNINDVSLTRCTLPKLYPKGKAITKKKYTDLMQLLQHVPIEHHQFFKELKCDDEVEDYGLASDASDE